MDPKSSFIFSTCILKMTLLSLFFFLLRPSFRPPRSCSILSDLSAEKSVKRESNRSKTHIPTNRNQSIMNMRNFLYILSISFKNIVEGGVFAFRRSSIIDCVERRGCGVSGLSFRLRSHLFWSDAEIQFGSDLPPFTILGEINHV